MASHYINTDLDIVSSDDLSHLCPLFDERCDLLYGQKESDGFWYIALEASGSGIRGDRDHHPEKTIEALLKVIDGLDQSSKEQLKKARKFDFNVGWQAGERQPEGSFCIPNEILQRVAKIGATISVTIYPSNENDLREEEL